jgi:RNA polymerase sigma-70 factor (ECF subfamily)
MTRGFDDEELDVHLGSARRGDQAGFTGLYVCLSGRVVSYLRSRGVGDVDEVVNDVFLAAFRNLATFEGDASAFRSWVFTIAWNKGADWHRAAGRRPRTTELGTTAPTPSVFDELPDSFTAGDVTSLLATLTPDQRDVLLLRIIADLSLAETADVLGKPTSAVKALQHRALAALARALGPSPVSLTTSETITRSR